MTSLTLPAATGGNGTLSYSLSPSLPSGLSFDAATRVLSGRPTAAAASATYTYTVSDADGITTAADKDTLTFTIAVAEASADVSFNGDTVRILHVASGSHACLDVSGGSASNGANVQSWECDGTDDGQLWRFERRTAGSHSGYYRLVSETGSDTHCLDNGGDFSNNGAVKIWSCVSDTHGAVGNQSFSLEDATGGGYHLSFLDQGLVWATRSGSDLSDNVVTKTDSTGNRSNIASKWRVVSASAPAFASNASIANLALVATDAIGDGDAAGGDRRRRHADLRALAFPAVGAEL